MNKEQRVNDTSVENICMGMYDEGMRGGVVNLDAKVFGAYIAAIRKEKGLTQSQIAEKIHVTDKAVSKWERGAGLPDINNIEALAEALDVSLTELIQCKKQEDCFIKTEDVSNIIRAAFDILKYQKQMLYKRIVSGLIFAAVGVGIVFAGIHYLLSPGFTIMGGDGPTSVFAAGRISYKLPAAAISVGCLLVMAGLWKMFKNKG